MKKLYLLFLIIAIAALSACSASTSTGPAEVIEKYLRALAEKDKATISSLSCAEWEEAAILEVDALLSVEAAIDELTCDIVNESNGTAEVVCNGSLDLTYDGEIRGIDLSRRMYTLMNNNSQWLVCSYK
jgi:hypothetical protein